MCVCASVLVCARAGGCWRVYLASCIRKKNKHTHTDEFGKGQEQRRERRRVRHVALLNVPSTDNCSLYTRKILILAQGPSNLAGSGAPAFLQVQEDDQSSLPMSLVASLDTVPVTCCVPLHMMVY